MRQAYIVVPLRETSGPVSAGSEILAERAIVVPLRDAIQQFPFPH